MILIAQGTHASVYAIKLADAELPTTTRPSEEVLKKVGGRPGWLAVKTVASENAVLEPHDVRKEIRVLDILQNENIITLLHSTFSLSDNSHHLYLPLLSIPLSQLFNNPSFSSLPYPSKHSSVSLSPNPGILDTYTPESKRASIYLDVVLFLTQQLLAAVSHLHYELDPPVAHRDIKPANVMLGLDGVVKLIDFGTCYEGRGGVATSENDGEEGREPCQVGTGPYRAPELLFGTGAEPYSPFAIDSWALGVTISTFFTPFVWTGDKAETVMNIDKLQGEGFQTLNKLEGYVEESEEEDSESSEDERRGRGRPSLSLPPPKKSFTSYTSLGRGGESDKQWVRQTLFDGNKGDLGLAWSIFRVKGTPNEKSWPEFKSLADASKISFFETQPIALDRLLPHLDLQCDDGRGQALLDVVSGMLEYSPKARLSPKEALKNDLFLLRDRKRKEEVVGVIKSFIPEWPY